MKKNKYKVLILTDHEKHSEENSLYNLSIKMLAHPMTQSVDIATRFNKHNESFFASIPSDTIHVTSIDQTFAFSVDDHPLSTEYNEVEINTYDLVWLRMPPPLSKDFLNFIDHTFSNSIIINNPKSIHLTGSKAFLTNFPTVSPPMKVCQNLNDIIEFKKQFPTIVLKPLREYGGKGIVKIEENKVSSNNQTWPFDDFANTYNQNPIDYIAVKYLKNVTKGDKRIIVVNGQILGASLRLPKDKSWICNVSMGGSSNVAEIEKEEEDIINLINPTLTNLGIVMYGVDTLVNDEGKRVLSEINTTSIGGLPQIASMNNEPVVEKAVDLIWDYFKQKTKENG